MDIEILTKKENKFLSRTELLLKIPHDGLPTPSKEELNNEIKKKFSTENADIRYIFSQKNKNYSIAKVFLKQ
ncbi:MAG: hypothetical protein B6U88_00900 [Candidatus Aenigmarchaeota archaeon ex4484_56]|nr:MAG: hypothetical protein B6U88_00900 [Candidatus Aenigmarchaeota archaeon ex4484_56]